MKDENGRFCAKKAGNAAKVIAVTAVYAALIVGVQVTLSFAAGVELVSLLIIVYSAAFGVRRGLLTALVFVCLRGLVFPYSYLNILIIYVVHFPILAIVSGLYGKLIGGVFDRREELKARGESLKNPLYRALSTRFVLLLIGLCVIVGLHTACFTLFDDLIAPPLLGLGEKSAKAYFIRSLPTLATHVTCVAGSVALLFTPLFGAIRYAGKGFSGGGNA